MLNEGYALYKSLERCGIRLTNRHPDIKEPGKSEGLIVGIDEHGNVTRLEYRKPKDIAALWTTREGNHNSFPVVKLQRPLWKVPKDDPVRETKLEEDKWELLGKRSGILNVTSSEINAWNRLQTRVRNLLPYFETKDQDYIALYELCSRFLRIKDVLQFSKEFLEILKKEKLVEFSIYETILIGRKWNQSRGEYRTDVPLVFDLSDWENYSIRVASTQMEQFASDCMFRMQEADQHIQGVSPSALSGCNVKLEDEKFPNPKLQFLGYTYLFAVNDQTPCQTRYKKTSTEIIPVGRDEAIAIQNSLNWITEEGRNAKTWYPVPSRTSRRDKEENDLLIVYLEDQPNLDVNNAHLLGGVSNDYISESTYESIASVAIQVLQGKKIINTNELIRLFALHKADPGRTQVSLQRIYSIAKLVAADKEWREAAKNTPPITMPFFRSEIKRLAAKKERLPTDISDFLSDKESRVIYLSPRCPFPADLVRITQKQWIRFGDDSRSAPGASLGILYDIYFAGPNGQGTEAEDLLNLILQRTQALLIGLGSGDHKSKAGDLGDAARFTALTSISSLAICLHKLGIRKEQYMEGTFFQVGRFLSLIDTLHFEYSKNVRGGDIPGQLLGTAHLQIALDSPVSAFDLLSRRIGIYKAWAMKEQGDQVKLARWAIGQLGGVSASLAEKPLPASTSSADRAQILLGYLAKSEGKKSKSADESTYNFKGDDHD